MGPVGNEKEGLAGNMEGESAARGPPIRFNPALKQHRGTIEELFARHRGIVAFGEFKQQLQKQGLWKSPKPFYRVMAEIGTAKFSGAIQKREENPSRVKAETYYISPAFHEIRTSFDKYRVIHNFYMEQAKNFLSPPIIIKDIARLDSKGEEELLISDLKLIFISGDYQRVTYGEYTSGGRGSMKKAILKIATNYSQPCVLLVGLEDPPRRTKTAPLGIRSNRKEAMEIAADLEVEVLIFTMTNLDELKHYCMTGKLPYTQR